MKNKINSYNQEIEKVFETFKTREIGLSYQESNERLEKYGENKLVSEKKFSIISLFLHQFKNPLIYILFFALIISYLSSHYADAIIIFIVILLSALVGFFQEYKANSALDQLKKIVQYKARVIRNNKEMVVNQENIVPGDIVVLHPGDKVPADIRLIKVKNLETIEASLTGESMSVEKQTQSLKGDLSVADRLNMAYMGTTVARGQAKGVVVATGSDTEIGKIARLVKNTKKEETPLQIKIAQLGKFIGLFLVIINIFIFILGISKGVAVSEMLLTSIAMIVAAVPEGLLPAMTIILAIGMQRLAKQNGLVRKMLATETLGAVSTICSDKTGTLTKGEMIVSKIFSISAEMNLEKNQSFSHLNDNSSLKKIFKIGSLCNNALIEDSIGKIDNWKVVGNPTDKALLLAGHKFGFEKDFLNKQEPRKEELPFESKNKFMVTSHWQADQSLVYYLKGAPEKVLGFSSFIDVDGVVQEITQEEKNRIIDKYHQFTNSGLRVIAFGYKLTKDKNLNLSNLNLTNFVFLGLVALKDPLRKEAQQAVELSKQAGIRTIMITGDHKLTAMSIGRELGLEVANDTVLEGVDLEKMSDSQLSKIIKKINIFARVEPNHKIRIVQALQRHNEIVAMTGDGVNDAPALKKADIGVAVGSGTDVSKEISDLVLLDDNFSTIIDAIKGGRGIFDNIRKVALYLLSSSFSEVFLIFFSLLFNLPLALLPIQILWIKMVEEPLPGMALSFDKIDKDVLLRKPRNIKENILNAKLGKFLIFFVLFSDIFLFLIFYYFFNKTGNIVQAQTIVFVGLGIASRFYIYSIRNLYKSIHCYKFFDNQLVNLANLFAFIMIFIAVYLPFFNNILGTTPLQFFHWLILLIYSLFTLLTYEIGKKIFLSKVK